MDPQSNIQRSLLRAIADGDPVTVAELVSAGANVNELVHTPDAETPLIRAVIVGQVAVVQKLIELGADADLPQGGGNGWTPLMFAREQPEIARELLRAGANVNLRGAVRLGEKMHDGRLTQFGGETALHLAAACNNLEVVQLLIRSGADVEAKAANGQAPLDIALGLGRANSVAEALVAAGAELSPERIELMHSTAHSTDSDLLNLTVQSPPPPVQSVPVEAPLGPLKCPTCGALIYSRRTRICAQCGTVLPVDMARIDQQEREAERRRQKAEELANAFGSGPARSSGSQPVPPQTVEASGADVSVEGLLRDYATEFANRKRPHVSLYLVGFFAVVFALVGFSEGLFNYSLPVSVLLILAGVIALRFFFVWRNANPICPKCNRDIRWCSASYCISCGGRLSSGCCGTCMRRDSFFWGRPARNGGCPITFCPSCGTHLNTRIWRRHFLSRF